MAFSLSKTGKEISIILERDCLYDVLHVGVSVLTLPAINSETVCRILKRCPGHFCLALRSESGSS